MEVFSTITSPVFSELVIVLGVKAAARLPSEVTLFETLRTMNEIRTFKLAFLLVAPDLHRENARRMLTGALGPAAASGLLDFLDSPPTIRCTRFPEYKCDLTFDYE
jgi:hypothetical protein